MKLFIAIVLFLLSVLPVYAGRGCCSWHGGQSYCDSNTGRWVCADGTYSPSCTCGYVAPPVYIPPTPSNPISEGTVNVVKSDTKPYYSVSLKWSSTLPVSIAISRTAGANPGPNVDTSTGFFEFNNVTSGRWFVNLKTAVNNVWSDVRYWTVDVPVWIDPTPTPTPLPTNTPTPSPTVSPTPMPNPEGKGTSTGTSNTVTTGGVGAAGLFGLSRLWKWLSSKFGKKNP